LWLHDEFGFKNYWLTDSLSKPIEEDKRNLNQILAIRQKLEAEWNGDIEGLISLNFLVNFDIAHLDLVNFVVSIKEANETAWFKGLKRLVFKLKGGIDDVASASIDGAFRLSDQSYLNFSFFTIIRATF
jgi:hypothetical protein